jgi:hypothetical protein
LLAVGANAMGLASSVGLLLSTGHEARDTLAIAIAGVTTIMLIESLVLLILY